MSTSQGLYFEPLVNQFQPGKLADLSAVSLVAGITHKNLLRMRLDTDMRTKSHTVPKLDEIGLIPKSIRSSLDELIDDAKKSWSEWWLHHHEKVFFKDQPADNLIVWFDLLVWLPDGTINYEQTARKLLCSDRLTKVQEFQLACAYCFIDDVERLKKTLTKNEMNQATDGHSFNRDQFLNYWSRRMNLKRKVDHENLLNELISKLEFDDDLDLESYDEWPAIKFFLSLIQTPLRTRKIKDIISLEQTRLTWLLLPTLSEIEFHSIISEESTRIMVDLLDERIYWEFALSVWHKMVHIIDNKVLVEIMHTVDNDLGFERSYVNDLLWRMWLALSELQKDFIADRGIINFIRTSLGNELDDYYSPHFPLIIDIFSRSRREVRDLDWKKYWPYLVVGQLQHKKSIDYIMKLCFDNDQQIQDFKKTTMTDYESIRKYCSILVKQGRSKDVQAYVKFCTSDPEIIRDLLETIVKKMPKDDLFDIYFYRRSEEAVADFNRYLECIFTEDERKLYFDKMIKSRSNLERMRSMLRYSENLCKVIKFVETFVSSKQSLINVKVNFLEHFRYRGCKSSVDLDLMAWCLNGDKSLVEDIKEVILSKDDAVETSSTDDDSEMSSTDDDVEVSQNEMRSEPVSDVYKIFLESYKW